MKKGNCEAGEEINGERSSNKVVIVPVVSGGEKGSHDIRCTDGFLFTIGSPQDCRYQTASLKSH